MTQLWRIEILVTIMFIYVGIQYLRMLFTMGIVILW